jgi:hypothetical protein
LSRGFFLAAAAVLAALGLVMSLLFWLCIRGPSVAGRLQSGQSRVLRADPRYFEALIGTLTYIHTGLRHARPLWC